MSSMQKLDCAVTGNAILFSSIDLEFRTVESSKKNLIIILFYCFHFIIILPYQQASKGDAPTGQDVVCFFQ